jgi:hypothetical protein
MRKILFSPRQFPALKHLANGLYEQYFGIVNENPSSNERLMKKNLHLENHVSVGSTVMKLALVSGALLSCMYGVLWIFASAFKVLG